ncbi:MAG TPA: response regulator [Tepiditoga sp.]|nr:response regulator [Tepiditoga sp.]
MKIMMAEDDRNISSIVEKYLKKSEYETVICENGTEALQKFDSSVNLVILDIMMPEIDGFSVLEEIRKISDVPVIMLTAKSSESDKIKGFDYGAMTMF